MADPINLKKVAEGVYLRPGQHGAVFEQKNLANIGFIVGKRCVAVIDTGGSLEEGKTLASAVKSVTNVPICYIINTHVHPDHILGNHSFNTGNTHFIGHRNLPRATAMLGPTYIERAARALNKPASNNWLVPPQQLIGKTQLLDLGERQLKLTAHSQAHTDNDLSVFDEKTRTLWTGDLLFTNHIPVIGGSGSVNGWLTEIDALASANATVIIPGHGPVITDLPPALNALKRYLKVLRDEIRNWLAKDGEIGPALDNIGYSEQKKWTMFDHFHRRNVSYAFTELEWE